MHQIARASQIEERQRQQRSDQQSGQARRDQSQQRGTDSQEYLKKEQKELIEYIRIPNKSPAFDKDWAAHGYMDDAVKLMEAWARARLPALKGATLEVVRLPNRTPVILIEVPGETKDTVLLYGHLDKQPEFTGWADGLGPWTPVRRKDKLYGRGGADDGYAVFASLAALRALHEEKRAHARVVVKGADRDPDSVGQRFEVKQ